MSNAVETYLDSKGIEYHLDGENAIFNCPFCGETEGKFGINVTNFLGQCFKGSCATKVNERSFKRHFNDTVEYKSNLEEEVTSQVDNTAKTTKSEPVPDVEAAHQKLLENTEILNWLNDERGFSLETIKAAKLGLGARRFGPKGTPATQALMFPYFEQGKCVGVKFRSLPPEEKDFRFTAGREVGLYRADVITKGMESLLCLEGESDALALVNAGITNVVGVPGCDGKKVTWDDKLQLPKKMYLVFDNDAAGQKGALSFATRFGIDQFCNVVLPQYELDVPVVDKHGVERTTIKDVNEFFTSGHTVEEFNQLLENARPFDIEGVTTMQGAFDKLRKKFTETGSFLPTYKFKWDSVNQRAKGINDGDMVVVLAAAKTGKTSWCLNQTEFMAANYGLNVHFDCQEMDAEDLLKKWAAMALETDEDGLTLAQIDEAEAISRKRTNGFLFTRSNPSNFDSYLDFLKRIKRRYDSGVIVIDNFQILVDLTIGRGNSNNRPSYMSMVSKKLKALAGELRTPIILISQPRGIAEGQMVTSNDSEGSTTLTKDCDLFFTLNRNPEVRMKMAQADSMGKLETNQSHSDNMYVEIALSRRSAGGMCTLKIDGAKSLIREFNEPEKNANTRKVLIAGIEIIDENDTTQI